MERILKEIQSLMTTLENGFPQPGSVEDETLKRLGSLSAVAATAHQSVELNAAFAALHQYWLTSINWCSPLSKGIEKLLIIQEEEAAGEGQAEPPL